MIAPTLCGASFPLVVVVLANLDSLAPWHRVTESEVCRDEPSCGVRDGHLFCHSAGAFSRIFIRVSVLLFGSPRFDNRTSLHNAFRKNTNTSLVLFQSTS